MSPRATIDAATEAFLETAAADLRAQLGSAAIDSLRLEQVGEEVELVATLAVAGDRLEVSRRGATLVEALWAVATEHVAAGA